MKELLKYLLKGITGKNDIEVEENVEGETVNLSVDAPEEYLGMIIGKGGKTIKMIRNILRVRATLEKKGVLITLPEGTPREVKN